jgi:hypothetical protein
MSHTQAVFEHSYQTEHIRQNLHRHGFNVLFPDTNVWDHDIESLLQDMSLKRDPNAPAEVSSEDLEAIQQRADVTHLCEVFEAARSMNPNRDRPWRPMYMQYNALIKRLSALTVVH